MKLQNLSIILVFIVLLFSTDSSAKTLGYGLVFGGDLYHTYGGTVGFFTYGGLKYWGISLSYHQSWDGDYCGANITVNNSYRFEFSKRIGVSIGSLTGIGILFTDKVLSEHIESFIGVFYKWKRGFLELALHTMVDPYHKKTSFNNCYTVQIKYFKIF